MSDEEQGRSSFGRSLSARLRRKEQVARGEAVPEMPDDDVSAGELQESEEDAALSDEELLAKYEVENPETIEDEARLDSLLEGKLPDRIRQMALRRMWRLNPMFRFADEMVEYGENYTDAATVIDGMTTAYQVGKGYLQKAFDAVDEVPEDMPEGGEKSSDEEVTEDASPDGEIAEAPASQDSPDQSDPDTVVPDMQTAEPPPEADVTDVKGDGVPSAEVPPPARAQRMVFRRSGG